MRSFPETDIDPKMLPPITGEHVGIIFVTLYVTIAKL